MHPGNQAIISISSAYSFPFSSRYSLFFLQKLPYCNIQLQNSSKKTNTKKAMGNYIYLTLHLIKANKKESFIWKFKKFISCICEHDFQLLKQCDLTTDRKICIMDHRKFCRYFISKKINCTIATFSLLNSLLCYLQLSFQPQDIFIPVFQFFVGGIKLLVQILSFTVFSTIIFLFWTTEFNIHCGSH